MKKKSVVVCTAIITCIVIFLIAGYFYKMHINKKKSSQLLEKTYQLIQTSNDEVISANEDEVMLEDEIIGVLVITKLEVEAPVKDGTTQEVMKTSVGHFIESDYWNGNVALASHNSGTNAHYFEKINTLEEGDEIEYKTKFGNKKYRVDRVFKISSSDWTEVEKNSSKEKENTITLITCINGLPKYRLCVKGTEM